MVIALMKPPEKIDDKDPIAAKVALDMKNEKTDTFCVSRLSISILPRMFNNKKK